MRGVVVAGIGTDVGKTVASAVLCEALGADYWKPVQSGTDDVAPDSVTVSALIRDGAKRVHPSSYSFKKSLSPHAAADAEGVGIDLDRITPPTTSAPLVIELAGGILVPLSEEKTNLDLIERLCLPVVVVSQHYLGSINHTLLTCEVLKAHGVTIAGILFNGSVELPGTESVIQKMTGIATIGRLERFEQLTAEAVAAAAQSIELSR
jgi:dethiobiotin synthetase